MAAPLQTDSPKMALPGQILLVIHDFEARSPDELSLSKGDRIELIERDDDFGDGWYLGKHLLDGRSGLFPQVYTTCAPRGISTLNAASTAARQSPSTGGSLKGLDSPRSDIHDGRASSSTTAPASDVTPTIPSTNMMEPFGTDSATPPPLNTTPPQTASSAGTRSPISALSQINSTTPRTLGVSIAGQRGPAQDSAVMNETLSVIDEHITDLNNTPRHSIRTSRRRGTNDSGSEYSTHKLDNRLSYITGHETDEEEQNLHTEAEVSKWTPAQVAEYLNDVGVEQKHCQIFEEQQISGDVLLSMDQETISLKEFDLGALGRRLRTWYKIKALQEEVKSATLQVKGLPTIPSPETSEGSLVAAKPNTVLPRIPSLMEKPWVTHRPRQSSQPTPEISQLSFSQSPKVDGSPTKPPFDYNARRPSAASIRELNHHRRHSSMDLTTTTASNNTPNGVASPRSSTMVHQKQPSLDRGWTMSSAIQFGDRPLTAVGTSGFGSNGISDYLNTDSNEPSEPQITSPKDLDRGYFSGGEAEGTRRFRNVLRKRESASHSRNSSYTDEQRHRTATASSRHSRFGSVDSTRGGSIISAAAREYHRQSKAHFRSASGNAAVRSSFISDQAPTITKIEPGDKSLVLVPSGGEVSDGSASPLPSLPPLQTHTSMSKRRGGALRAISDAVTGGEKAMVSSPADSFSSATKQSPSPATGSTTPSGSKSFEFDPLEGKGSNGVSPSTGMGSLSGASRRKSKKETSAYTRGLEKKTPQEQMQDCSKSGWMKKKSSTLMTTWKPRLFILRGCRLSYYYSENDTQEKGLIDISGHRILPVNNDRLNDRLTGIHATVTGASKSPTSPQNALTPSMTPQDEKSTQDGVFIFKLVPPRHGQGRAVNFTKPTVHYFACDNRQDGKDWMAAMMRATINRDESKPAFSSYQHTTISLTKAQAMRHRPPALMNDDDSLEQTTGDEQTESNAPSEGDTLNSGLNITGVIFDHKEQDEKDSGVGSMEGKKSGGVNEETSASGVTSTPKEGDAPEEKVS